MEEPKILKAVDIQKSDCQQQIISTMQVNNRHQQQIMSATQLSSGQQRQVVSAMVVDSGQQRQVMLPMGVTDGQPQQVMPLIGVTDGQQQQVMPRMQVNDCQQQQIMFAMGVNDGQHQQVMFTMGVNNGEQQVKSTMQMDNGQQQVMFAMKMNNGHKQINSTRETGMLFNHSIPREETRTGGERAQAMKAACQEMLEQGENMHAKTMQCQQGTSINCSIQGEVNMENAGNVSETKELLDIESMLAAIHNYTPTDAGHTQNLV